MSFTNFSCPSANVAESAESLRDNLVIDQKDVDKHHQGADASAKQPMSMSGKVKSPATHSVQPWDSADDVCTTSREGGIALSQVTSEKSNPVAELCITKSGAQTYTKIIPVHDSISAASTIVSHSRTLVNLRQRLKEDPRLQHLQICNRQKAPLLRSTSMPVSIKEGEVQSEEKTDLLLHRKIYRTGSISDYTKQKLKSTILLKTSASLVRKPSITDYEMQQIRADADSSQSDDEDEEDEVGGRFKAVTSDGPTISDDAGLRPDSSCSEVQAVSSAACIISSLPGTSVKLAVSMTTA